MTIARRVAVDRTVAERVPRVSAGPPSREPGAGPRRQPGPLDLQRLVGNRATTAALQRFWVKEGGKYRWESDEAKKRNFVATSETYWNWWHWSATPVHVPPNETVTLSGEMFLGLDDETKKDLTDKLLTDLQTIARVDIGRKLLGALARGRHGTTVMPVAQQLSSGPITQAPMRPGFDPTDPTRGAPPTVFMLPGSEVDVRQLPLERIGEEEPGEPDWNPTPSHVALFHELVHAYHYVTGTAATGKVTAEQAHHPGDVGQSMSEYQATGLDTRDGARTFAADEQFTENKYRAAVRIANRDTYIPRGLRTPAPPPPL